MLIRDLTHATHVVPSDVQLYGIEVEVENWNPGPQPRGVEWKWLLTEDGSLRNGGVEFISPGPWDFSTCVEQYEAMCRSIRELSWTPSPRTSVHVHVNCLDRTPSEVGGILAAYLAVEPVLFLLCGPEREENIFCVPWYRAASDVDKAKGLIYGETMAGLGECCKYSSLNLAALRRFGTMEFRHAPTYTSPEDFKNWLTAIQSVVEYGRERTVESVLAGLYRGSLNLLVERIFGAELANYLRGNLSRDSSFEALCDKHDTVGVVEMLLPNEPCTYKPPPIDGWEDGPEHRPTAPDLAAPRAEDGGEHNWEQFASYTQQAGDSWRVAIFGELGELRTQPNSYIVDDTE